MHKTKLEKYLLANQLIADDKLHAAKQAANKAQQTLVAFLVKHKKISANKLACAVASVFNLPQVNLLKYSIAKLPLKLVPARLIMQTNILPLAQQHDRLDVALIDPCDLKSIDIIKFHTGMKLNIFIARYDNLQQLIQQVVTKGSTEELDVSYTPVHAHQENYNLNFADNSDEPLIRFINHIIEDAICNKASDIHFEVYEQYCRVRFRQDGILREVTKPPQHIASRIASRLKIMAKLDISERRLPQDGHCKIKINHQMVEARASSCPTTFGEKIVLRLLNNNNVLRGIQQLDFNQKQQDAFINAINQPQGLILVTGPTGSGKTVTLYAALQYLNKIEKNIATIEDPVEINLNNVNQVNVKVKAGLTFAKALRAFLRQDPDIIMVGEIRDFETAEIAIKAAQTGHLVISTLHTNSALEALTRLRNMGIAPYNIISSIILITAQRLVRKLCPHCKQEHKVSALMRKQFNFPAETVIYNAVGCQHCVNGYSGRIAIHEVLSVNEDFCEPIFKGENTFVLEKIAKRNGFVILQQAALEKVIQGVTSIQEIYRVIGY